MDIARAPQDRPLSTRKPSIAFFAAAALVALTAFATSMWKTSAVAAPAVDHATMWTERVRRGDLVRQVPVQGTLVPEHVQWLSAQSAARVAKIVLRAGAHVEPETVVVVLENTDLELAAIEAERQAASAEARLIELDVKGDTDEAEQALAVSALRADLGEAERHAGDAVRLGTQGLVSDNERRDAIARTNGLADRLRTEDVRRQAIVRGRGRQASAQHAEIDRLKEIAAFRRRQLAALEVRAGIAGTVQDVPLENGQWVAIGTLLAKVAEPGRLKAELRVAEGNARDVERGLAVRFENAAFRGRVERVDPSVVGGSVKLEVKLDDASPAGARVDQAVTGFVEIEKLEKVLFVARPSGARDGAAAGVFRLDADRAFASRVNVTLGHGSAREVEILSGLAEGDEVVVSDVSSWDAPRVRLK